MAAPLWKSSCVTTVSYTHLPSHIAKRILRRVQPIVLADSIGHAFGLHLAGAAVPVSYTHLYALKTEYKLLAEQKKQLQQQYAEVKRQMQEYGIIKQNVDCLLYTSRCV